MDTNIARDVHHVCISVCVYMYFTCSYELGSALIPVLWQVEQSEKLIIIARMNEKPLTEIGLKSGFYSLLFSSELQKINLEGTRGHLLHPAAPGRINSNETAPDRYLPNFFLKPLTMEIPNVLWVVTLAASWILAHNQLSCHWDLLYSAQNFIANLRNTGQSGSMG